MTSGFLHAVDARISGLAVFRFLGSVRPEKWLAGASCCFLAWTSAHSFAEEIDVQKLDRQCRASVVFIVSELEDGQGAQGTGFIVSADGKVVTNHHVIAGGLKFHVQTADQKEIPVKQVLADDGVHDIAVLQLDAANLPALPLAEDGETARGSRIVVIGNPLGLDGSISDGLISAIRQDPRYGEIFQITAPISHGSSGSPVLNAQGKVIGVATLGSEEGQALNFAVSARNVRDLLAHPRTVAAPNQQDFTFAGDNLPTEETRKQDGKALLDPLFANLRALEKKHSYPEMLASARDLAKAYPKSAVAQRRLCDAYWYSSFYEDSLAACKKALQLDPKSGRGWNNLAIFAHGMRDRATELHAYQEGLKAAPTDVKLWLEYGKFLAPTEPSHALDAIHSAMAFLKEGKGIDAESSNYPLFSHAARTLRTLGRTEEAYDAALLGVKRDPGDPDAWRQMASCALAMKKYAHVWPYLQRAFAAGGPPDALYMILAESESAQGQIDQSLDSLHRARQANALNKYVFVYMVRVHLSRDSANLTDADYTEMADCIARLKLLDVKLCQETAIEINQDMKRRNIDWGVPVPQLPPVAPPLVATTSPQAPARTAATTVSITPNTASAPAESTAPKRSVPEHAVALDGQQNQILAGPNVNVFSGDEMQFVNGLGIGEVQLPDRRSLTYFHLDTTVDNETPSGVLAGELTADIRVLCQDGNGIWNVTRYTKKFDLATRGPQHVGLGGVFALDVIRLRNNNDEIPKNVYLAFKYHDKVFEEVLLGKAGAENWWRQDDLVKPLK